MASAHPALRVAPSPLLSGGAAPMATHHAQTWCGWWCMAQLGLVVARPVTPGATLVARAAGAASRWADYVRCLPMYCVAALCWSDAEL
eukprot:gene37889-23022_t